MTNYRAYLKGYASGSGPSKGELRLRAARRSGDPKKIAEALNALPRAEGVGTKIPHLEREETFGSTKRKLDVPIGDAGDSHRLNKIFSQPHVRTRSTPTVSQSSGDKGEQAQPNHSRHVTVAFEVTVIHQNGTLLGSVRNPTQDAKLNSIDQKSSALARLRKGRRVLRLLLTAVGKKSMGVSERWWQISGFVRMTFIDA